MQVVCVGLLLLSVTCAAPVCSSSSHSLYGTTLQKSPYQTRHCCPGTAQDSESSAAKASQAPPQGCGGALGVGQKEKSKDSLAGLHLHKRTIQEPRPKEVLSTFEANENDLGGSSLHHSAHRQAQNEASRTCNHGKAHGDLKVSVHPETTREQGPESRASGISHRQDQDHGTHVASNTMQSVMQPVTAPEQRGEGDKEKPKNQVLSKSLSGVPSADAHSRGKKRHPRATQAQKSPAKTKSAHQIPSSIHYQERLIQAHNISGDSEGSGYTDLQRREDSDFFPFSGDGPPAKDVFDKKGAIVPDLESIGGQTRLPSPHGAELRGVDDNEIPEGMEQGGSTPGARDGAAGEARAASVSLVDSGDHILGSTNYRELPGQEGTLVDSGSQNAHQGRIGLHYPHGPSKGKPKEGAGDTTQSASYNEIPKSGKGSTRKAIPPSYGNQLTFDDKHQVLREGKSQGLPAPSHGLSNEINHEIGPHFGPSNEGKSVTHGIKPHFVPHGKSNSVGSKGWSPRTDSWAFRKPHPNRNFHPSRRGHSSESSDSSSSSESQGD
ncbi:matrix extracellular phosphoglycoprotein [Ctenodactylus gundi]